MTSEETRQPPDAPRWMALFFGGIYWLFLAATLFLLFFVPVHQATAFWQFIWFVSIVSLVLLCASFPFVLFGYAGTISLIANRVHFGILLGALAVTTLVLLFDAATRRDLQSFTGGMLAGSFTYVIWKVFRNQ